MTDWVKKALTRKITDKTALQENAAAAQEVPPDERLVLGTKFAIAFTFCLSAIEIANLAVLGTWNSEVFAVITGLAGTITGRITLFRSQRNLKKMRATWMLLTWVISQR